MHHTVFFGGYIIVGLVLFIMLFSAIEGEITKRLDKFKQMVGLVENAQEDQKDCWWLSLWFEWNEMKWKNLLVSVVFSFIKKTEWGHYLLDKITYLNEVESIYSF